MIDTGDVTMFCHWNKRLVCKKGFYCDTCKHQLAADDKENGKAEPVQLRWTEDYDGGRVPECPSCGNMPYSLERCIFCGQRFLPDALTKEWSKPPEEVRMDWSLLRRGEYAGRRQSTQQRTLSRSMHSLRLCGDGMKRSFYGTI